MIGSVSQTAAGGTSPASANAPKALGQADFIHLMTTQMRLQDPLDPVDNKEMIAQMAQFSSLAGINDINLTLQAIAAKLDHMTAIQTPSASPAA
jgi:flagellar basal-body rod modification protein FlgD